MLAKGKPEQRVRGHRTNGPWRGWWKGWGRGRGVKAPPGVRRHRPSPSVDCQWRWQHFCVLSCALAHKFNLFRQRIVEGLTLGPQKLWKIARVEREENVYEIACRIKAERIPYPLSSSTARRDLGKSDRLKESSPCDCATVFVAHCVPRVCSQCICVGQDNSRINARAVL